MATTSELIRDLRAKVAQSELRKPITASDLRCFDLPVPNNIVPFPLPWRDRAQFALAMFFNQEVARHAYLRVLMDTLAPPSKTSH